MKYILTGQDINGKTIHDVFKIKTLKGDSRIFHSNNIMENIIKHQCQKGLTFGIEWIDEIGYNNFKYNFNNSIIDLNILEICLTSLSSNIFGKNIDKDSLIRVQIELETEDEINMYLKLFIEESYDVQQPISGILDIDYKRALCASPYIDFDININKITEVGDYIVFLAFVGKYQKWFYVIQKDQLNDNTIDINCYFNLIPHIIGKKGKNINILKYELKAKYGGEKLKRIQLIPILE